MFAKKESSDSENSLEGSKDDSARGKTTTTAQETLHPPTQEIDKIILSQVTEAQKFKQKSIDPNLNILKIPLLKIEQEYKDSYLQSVKDLVNIIDETLMIVNLTTKSSFPLDLESSTQELSKLPSTELELIEQIHSLKIERGSLFQESNFEGPFNTRLNNFSRSISLVDSILRDIHKRFGGESFQEKKENDEPSEYDNVKVHNKALTPKAPLETHIRWMIKRDMKRVLSIEGESSKLPWSEEDFASSLRKRNCIGMVAERGEQILGFVIYELYKKRIHISKLAVRQNAREQTVGKQMANKLIGKLSSHRRTRLSIEVRESNLAAQLFLQKSGFIATTIFKDFYNDSHEDAYLMQYCHLSDEIGDSSPI